MCVYKGLIEVKAVMPVIWKRSHRSDTLRRADGRVGRADESTLFLILGCTSAVGYVLCMKSVGKEPCPSTRSAPLAAPPKPAVST